MMKLSKWHLMRMYYVLLVLSFGIGFFVFNQYRSRNNYKSADIITITAEAETVNLALVTCQDSSIEPAVDMMTSAILFRGTLHIHFMIVCEYQIRGKITREMEILKSRSNGSVTYDLYNISFPVGEDKFWYDFFKPCATQRLFFSSMFNVDKLLYVDLDIIFLNSLSDIWQLSYKMNQSQLIGMGPDLLDSDTYIRFFKPRYPLSKAKLMNSGIEIMDLKKMRQVGWQAETMKTFRKYRKKIQFPVQDISRLTFLFQPDKLYFFPCNINFITPHCYSRQPCEEAKLQGVYSIHGCGSSFGQIPVIREIHQTFKSHELGIDTKEQLVTLLKKKIEALENGSCRNLPDHLFLKHIHKLLD